MSKLIKTDCETFNLFLKSLYVYEIELEEKGFSKKGLEEEED